MPHCLLSREEAKDLARRNVVLTGFDDDCVEHTIQWQRNIDGARTNPTANENGVSGYCILDGVPSGESISVLMILVVPDT